MSRSSRKARIAGSGKEDAVSEAIGFILIFSLVMMGIGLITLYGYPILLEQQSNANVRNMERDMIVLQNDMKSLVYKNVPYKETSLQVSGGALSVYDYASTKPSITIYVNDVKKIFEFKYGQLIYESDAGESIIALENGAVFTRMEFQEGSAMLAEPRWFIDYNNNTGNNTLIIALVKITSKVPMSRNGIGTVKMQLESYNAEDPIYTLETDKITIEYLKEPVKFDFSKGWENYINSLETQYVNINCANSPTDLTCDITGINTLIVKTYEIEILSI
jgi:hypothetical protein